MTAFHYVVRAKYIKYIQGNGEMVFEEHEKKFENESPIIARDLAFKYYQSFIEVMLETKHSEYSSESQAKEFLKSFIDPGLIEPYLGMDVAAFSETGIGIFMVVDMPRPNKSGDINKKYEINYSEEYAIHGIGHIGWIDDPENIIDGLDEEYKYYEYYKYPTGNKEIEVVFYHEWDEDFDDVDEDEYEGNETHKILKTPFDWTGYDKRGWWEDTNKDQSTEIQPASKQIAEIIQRGEGEQVEFKPSLNFNFNSQNRWMEKEELARGKNEVNYNVSKAICAFLNSKGGLLLIGVKDDKTIQGLEYDFSLSYKEDKLDYFKTEFDRVLNRFFGFSIKSLIHSDFVEVEGKLIWIVEVGPSFRRPVFLKNDENQKEFFIRGNASCRQLTDIEEIVHYSVDRQVNYLMKKYKTDE